jgi:signal transduction histidine kinase
MKGGRHVQRHLDEEREEEAEEEGVKEPMSDPGPGETSEYLALRLEETHAELARQWLERLADLLTVQRQDVFPSRGLLDHIPELILEIAGFIRSPEHREIAANTAVMAKAAELGRMRFDQRASVHQLMREYQILAEILERFLQHEATRLGSAADTGQALSALSRAAHAVRILQQETVDAFVQCYTDTMERQTAQLRSFSRLVSHEIRQPLGVLQVLSRMLPIPEGDAGRLVETLERNVVRLGEVAGKLERLARLTRRADNTPSEQLVDVGGMASEIAHQLADMASARDVRIEIEPDLPSLVLDAGRLELALMNLFSNAVKYADPSKARRFVRLRGLPPRPGIALQVEDNGIGIPRSKLDAIFEQFVRVHRHLDDELGAQGLGLGLSIVRECMDAMGGWVTVESVEGEGATFTVEWPADRLRPRP